MGVTGCGKSTVGNALAAAQGWTFVEADHFHSKANIEKMTSGVPLTDQDRVGWMDSITSTINTLQAPIVVLACSALTRFVQSRLDLIPRDLFYVYLETTHVDLGQRLTARDHFMPVGLIDSQKAALNLPDSVITYDANQPVQDIISDLSKQLSANIPVRTTCPT